MRKAIWLQNVICRSVLTCLNHFSQLLNVHGISDVRQTEIHIAERLVPEPSAFEVEMAVEKKKKKKQVTRY